MVELVWEVGNGFLIILMTVLRGSQKIYYFIYFDLFAILDVLIHLYYFDPNDIFIWSHLTLCRGREGGKEEEDKLTLCRAVPSAGPSLGHHTDKETCILAD